MKTRYRIVRMFRNDDVPNQVVAENLTLKQAQAHCKNPETSSSKCTTPERKAITEKYGPWFDGYEEQK